jgi:hypothetical protein
MPQMQKLKKLLNTGYIVAYWKGYKRNDYIGIGTGYVHDIIHMDSVTSEVSYSMDRKEEDLSFPELIENSKKLKALIKDGQIKDILSGDDDPDINNIPVFYEESGEILSTFCADPGWPNTTISGELMYENSHFPTGREAAENAYGPEKYYLRELEDIDERIRDFQGKIESQKKYKQETIERRRKLQEYLKI